MDEVFRIVELWNLCMGVLLHVLCVTGIIVVTYTDNILILVEENTRVLVESRASVIMRVV